MVPKVTQDTPSHLAILTTHPLFLYSQHHTLSFYTHNPTLSHLSILTTPHPTVLYDTHNTISQPCYTHNTHSHTNGPKGNTPSHLSILSTPHPLFLYSQPHTLSFYTLNTPSLSILSTHLSSCYTRNTPSLIPTVLYDCHNTPSHTNPNGPKDNACYTLSSYTQYLTIHSRQYTIY